MPEGRGDPARRKNTEEGREAGGGGIVTERGKYDQRFVVRRIINVS